MDFTHDILDLAFYEEKKLKPATLINRKASERWLVRDMPLGVTAKPTEEWGWACDGDVVRIPLFPYVANGPDPVVAMAYAVELGMKARDMVAADYDVLRAHLTVGYPIQEANIPGAQVPVLRFWFGFAFVVKEKR